MTNQMNDPLSQITSAVESVATARQDEIVSSAVRIAMKKPCAFGQTIQQLREIEVKIEKHVSVVRDWWCDIDPAINNLIEADVPFVHGYDIQLEELQQAGEKLKVKREGLIEQLYMTDPSKCKQCNECLFPFTIPPLPSPYVTRHIKHNNIPIGYDE